MLKRSIILLPILVVAVFAWLQVAIALSLVPASGEICDQAKNAAQENCATHHIAYFSVLVIGKFIEDHNGAFTTVATFFIGAFTYTLWRSTNRLWLTSLRQLNAVEASSERQLRAYTLLYSISINNVADPLPILEAPNPNPIKVNYPKIGPRAHVEIKNSGQTPAYNVVHWAHIEFREYPLASPLTPRKKIVGQVGISRQILGPDDKGTQELSLPVRLSDEQIASLRARTHAIYVYGAIFYLDAFKRRRRTKYCYFQMEGAPGHIGICPFFTAYHAGNSAT